MSPKCLNLFDPNSIPHKSLGPFQHFSLPVCASKKKFRNFPCQDTPARSYSKFFLAGASCVSPESTNNSQKCTNSYQTVQIPQNGMENDFTIPCQELLARKSQHFFSPGCLEEFSPRTDRLILPIFFQYR